MSIENYSVVKEIKDYTFNFNFLLPFQVQRQYDFKIWPICNSKDDHS